MKYFPSVLTTFSTNANTKRNILLFTKFILLLSAIVTAFSIAFHFLMAFEGQRHSWITGLYWTLTVMTTLGFGDITFHSDLGRLFSILVLMSGVVFMLILLPFTIIKFLWTPWIEAEKRNRTPRRLPPGTRNHVIITNYGSVTAALIQKLKDHMIDYAVLTSDYKSADALYEKGIRVAVGELDDPETYRKLCADKASLVVACNSDEINTNISFTVRELSDTVRIVTTADSIHSVDILELAGSNRVLQIHEELGRSLANWTLGGTCRANIISRFGDLLIAEFPAVRTPLVDKRLFESRLREDFGVSVVGIWERGVFKFPEFSTVINNTSVLVLAGSSQSLAAFDEVYSFYHLCRVAGDPVIVIGGGRVGRTIISVFQEREIPFFIVDKEPQGIEEIENQIIGDAADIKTLHRALIDKAPAALITTHDDDVNIYLTKYLRSLRPNMQILSRATRDRNISTLHRAGADFVMSYSSLGANSIFNYLRNEQTAMPTEGLNIFRLPVAHSLVGKKLAESKIRNLTGCSVAAIDVGGVLSVNPDPNLLIPAEAELIMIGTHEGEKAFLKYFGK